MGRGVHRGFITHEELNKSLGKRNLSSDNLAQAFMHILDENIVLVEKKSDYKILRKKDASSNLGGPRNTFALLLKPYFSVGIARKVSNFWFEFLS